jgi:hypothetical protein
MNMKDERVSHRIAGAAVTQEGKSHPPDVARYPS